MDNVNFERDPKNLFEKVKRRTNHIAHILKIKTFVKKNWEVLEKHMGKRL